MTNTPPPWPKRPDGSNKTMGEMTQEERRAQTTAACRKLEREFAQPAFQDAIRRVLENEEA